MQGDRGDQGQSRRGRIAFAQPDQGAGVQIALGRVPFPPLAAPPPGLPPGAKPAAFGGAVAGERGEIVIGRAGLGDNADQNKALAALRVSGSSNGMSR